MTRVKQLAAKTFGHVIFGICMAVGWVLGWLSAFLDWVMLHLWNYVNHVNSTFELKYDKLLAKIYKEANDE